MNYSQLHYWAKKQLKAPGRCPECGQVKRLDLANKSQKYKQDLNDWLWLCRSCHIKYDMTNDKIEKLKEQGFKKDNIPWNKNKKGIHLSKKSEFKKGHKIRLGIKHSKKTKEKIKKKLIKYYKSINKK